MCRYFCSNSWLVIRISGLITSLLLLGILWGVFVGSGSSIKQIEATITGVDLRSLGDCNPLDKEKHDIKFLYNYTYENTTYDGSYNVCETNDGASTQFDIRKIGTPIHVYIKPDNPDDSATEKFILMDHWAFGFAIFFSATCLLCVAILLCDFDDVSEALQKEFKRTAKKKTRAVIDAVV